MSSSFAWVGYFPALSTDKAFVSKTSIKQNTQSNLPQGVSLSIEPGLDIAYRPNRSLPSSLYKNLSEQQGTK